MTLRPRKDGTPGPKQTVSARKVAEMLGLKDAPPVEPPAPDSPAAARLRSEGKAKAADALMEAAKEHYVIHTVPAGREAMAASAIRPEELPVGVEAKLGPPPKPRPTRRDGWQADGSYDGAVNAPPPAAVNSAEADKLKADYRIHVAKIKGMAEKARGDAAAEARVAEQARASAEVGEHLKVKLAELGMEL